MIYMLTEIGFVYKLAELLLNEEFGRCYTCENRMKNITLDRVNNGCDGNCSHTREWTAQEFLQALHDDYMRSEMGGLRW